MKRRTNYLKVLKPFAFILPNECLSGLHGEQKKKKDYRLLGRIPAASFLAFTYLHFGTECWNVGTRQFFIILFLFNFFFFSSICSLISFQSLERRKLEAQREFTEVIDRLR